MIDFTRLKQRLYSDGPKGLFLFIVLLGILPAIEDFSLFAVFGFSITKFHVHEEFRLLYSIPLYLIPIALLLVMHGRSYSRILGLLPAFFAGYVHLIGTSENVSLAAASAASTPSTLTSARAAAVSDERGTATTVRFSLGRSTQGS